MQNQRERPHRHKVVPTTANREAKGQEMSDLQTADAAQVAQWMHEKGTGCAIVFEEWVGGFARVLETSRVRFTLGDEVLTAEEVLAEDGFRPALLECAAEMLSRLMPKGYVESTFEVVEVDGATNPFFGYVVRVRADAPLTALLPLGMAFGTALAWRFGLDPTLLREDVSEQEVREVHLDEIDYDNVRVDSWNISSQWREFLERMQAQTRFI